MAFRHNSAPASKTAVASCRSWMPNWWQAGRTQFEETLRLCGAERGAMILTHAGNPWDVLYSQGCSPEELESLREGPAQGWEMSEAVVRTMTVRLCLFETAQLSEAQVNVYLHLVGATFAMFL